MKNYRSSEKVNAGSMADIAFLLLIFFLVTTTITTDAGINRNLPEPCPYPSDCNTYKVERNVLRIDMNANDDLLVANKRIQLEELAPILASFIDNNGDGSCTYCKGNGNTNSSDNPQDAIISLQYTRGTHYDLFVSVQDAISKTYQDLQTNYALDVFNKPLEKLSASELKQVKQAYPIKLSEADSN